MDLDSSGFLKFFSISINSFIRWDAVHFLAVAYNNGYSFEQQFAFFPGLPFLMRALANTLLKPLLLLGVDEISVLALSGVLISNVSSVIAACMLFKLTQKLFNNDRLAFNSSILFIMTPTPLIMSSIYTESLFSLLSFSGLYFFQTDCFWTSSFIWAFSTFVRSNGILFVGYFIFDAFFVYRWRRFSITKNSVKLFSLLVQTLLILTSFLSFQVYAYSTFCSNQEMAKASPWCYDRVPLLNCGFLTYFRLPQLPNFLLASPFIILSYWGIAEYACANPVRFFTLGLRDQTRSPSKAASKDFAENPAILSTIYLWLVMVTYCLTSMHVQVMLRFLTSCPALYWFVAQLLISYPNSLLRKLILSYWVMYGIISIILFSNFLPPA
ncbi:ER membrane glycoprotein subunit of the GPI transamidase complex-like protein [Entomophthora muscae]|uniref:ER membrane glycoprotein subunit of the GPI transamidase complex-like protein n=1 Tax=Entomophthora muscae TaxID=34485 RepID=A0ACC2S8Q6_9FUNG|nr:ER membrane glycoprotein subunit of the GPI transamidase complex-like protein [Entomophthora muscae]